jgi:hypothetical protein
MKKIMSFFLLLSTALLSATGVPWYDKMKEEAAAKVASPDSVSPATQQDPAQKSQQRAAIAAAEAKKQEEAKKAAAEKAQAAKSQQEMAYEEKLNRHIKLMAACIKNNNWKGYFDDDKATHELLSLGESIRKKKNRSSLEQKFLELYRGLERMTG